MPAGYEKIRDTLLTRGLSRKAAQGKAAKIWNAKHPDNPVGRHNSKKTILTS